MIPQGDNKASYGGSLCTLYTVDEYIATSSNVTYGVSLCPFWDDDHRCREAATLIPPGPLLPL